MTQTQSDVLLRGLLEWEATESNDLGWGRLLTPAAWSRGHPVTVGVWERRLGFGRNGRTSDGSEKE